jgi:hypothetical protein
MKIQPYLVIRDGSRSVSYRVTKEYPNLDMDEIAIRLNLDIPNQIFKKPLLTANITVPIEAVTAPVIESETITNVEEMIKQGLGFEVKLTVVNPETI